MKKILILTGGSRGIGEGIIKAYLENGFEVYSLSRGESQLSHEKLIQLRINLTHHQEVTDILDNIFREFDYSTISSITLINNAGILGKVAPLKQQSLEEITEIYQINSVVPAYFSAKFIQKTEDIRAEKKIVNISSGAAANPYFGWSGYCATKASLDMLTKCIAVEQTGIENGVKAISIYPGVVDTQMQTQIRATSETNFKDVGRFISMKEEGQLADSQQVGKKIFNLVEIKGFANGEIIDLRD